MPHLEAFLYIDEIGQSGRLAEIFCFVFRRPVIKDSAVMQRLYDVIRPSGVLILIQICTLEVLE